ncbi:MAG: hypothetical protein HXY25_00495 [Alphaproteobacteria bacterium]|nr:hypothetical protein [Alphaproteobacteria bacterium]
MPGRVGETLLLMADGPGGIGSLRADLGGFFLLCAACAGLALFRGRTGLLLVPLFLMGFALFARTLGLALDGVDERAFTSMAVEAVAVLILLFCRAVLPARG